MSTTSEELIELLRREIARLKRQRDERPRPVVVYKPSEHVPTDVQEVVNHGKAWAKWLRARIQATRPDLVDRASLIDHQEARRAGLVSAAEVALYLRVTAMRDRG